MSDPSPPAPSRSVPPSRAPGPLKDDLYLAALRGVFWVVCVGIFVFAGKLAWPFVNAVLGVLSPFLVGLLLAYVLHPVVGFAEKRLRLGRIGGIISVAVGFILAATLLLAIVLPILYHQARSSVEGISVVVRELDEMVYFSDLSDRFTERLDDFLSGLTDDDEAGTGESDGEGTERPRADDPPPIDFRDGADEVRDDDRSGTETLALMLREAEAQGGGNRFEHLEAFLQQRTELIKPVSLALLEVLDHGVGATASLVSWFGGFVASLVLTLIVTFYYLIEMSRIPGVIRKLLPVQGRERYWEILSRADRDVGGFLRGQLLVSMCVGTLTVILLLIVGPRKYALLIGVLAGLMNFVPYLGPVMGAAPAVMWGLFNGQMETMGDRGVYLALVVGGFGLIQAMDGFVFQPFIVGKQAALHPLTVMLALVVGSRFGLVGMILAVPVACVVKVFFVDLYWGERTDFLDDPRPPSAPPRAESPPPKSEAKPAEAGKDAGESKPAKKKARKK